MSGRRRESEEKDSTQKASFVVYSRLAAMFNATTAMHIRSESCSLVRVIDFRPGGQ